MKIRVDYEMQFGKSLAFYRVTLALERSIFVNELSPKRQLSVDAQSPYAVTLGFLFVMNISFSWMNIIARLCPSHHHSMMDIYRRSLLRANRPMYRPQCVLSVIHTSSAHWTAMMWGMVYPINLCEHQIQKWTKRGDILQMNNWNRIENIIYLSWENRKKRKSMRIDVNRRINKKIDWWYRLIIPSTRKCCTAPPWSMPLWIYLYLWSMNDGRLVHIASMRRVHKRLKENTSHVLLC